MSVVVNMPNFVCDKFFIHTCENGHQWMEAIINE